VRNYAIPDVLSRFYRMNGYNVLQPIGWDAFGLPAENAAIEAYLPPAVWTYQNIANMKQQLMRLGFSFDWSREITTCKPAYYRWQQWLFLQFYQQGLVYRKQGMVNWDPVDQTVLANEQVIDGRGWRSGALVEKKSIPMYYFAITKYAEELLDTSELTQWPASVVQMQQNWIGKSVGMSIKFSSEFGKITVFSTRPDTLMGVSYLALAYNHPLVAELLASNNHTYNAAMQTFIATCTQPLHHNRQENPDKNGVFSGYFATHPLDDSIKIPIWLADYVLLDYGTGAVMGVPAHDARDAVFAAKYHLISTKVIADEVETSTASIYLGYGRLINSGKYNGMDTTQAWNAISTDLAAAQHGGESITNYRLRDWGISRQRYWGCPIPLINCQACGIVPVPEAQLPVILPEHLVPTRNGNPLAADLAFMTVTCPQCSQPASRESDTMDTFVDSSWYLLRQSCCDNQEQALDERVKFWAPIDQYVGGIEHAVLHLLYARFFYKALRDLGLVQGNEPFKRLLTQGMVLADTFYQLNPNGSKTWLNINNLHITKDHKGTITATTQDGTPVQHGGMEKMSKSKYNGIDPDDIISQYGADALRVFLLFATPPEQTVEWSISGIEGAQRFLRRLHSAVQQHLANVQLVKVSPVMISTAVLSTISTANTNLQHELHKTIAKVTADIAERQQFNTAIAALMELLNHYDEYTKASTTAASTNITDQQLLMAQQVLQNLVILLSPFAPHLCEKLWQQLYPQHPVDNIQWPQADSQWLVPPTTTIMIQINGKLRDQLTLATADMPTTTTELLPLVLAKPKIATLMTNKEAKRIIHVTGLVNIVI
jgi:leucyl-tRNA synthetase